MTKFLEFDGFLELLEDDGLDGTLLSADFDEKEIRTDCAEPYYDYAIPMDEFLEFADRIREKLKEQEGKK